MGLREEIGEQPAVVARLLHEGRPAIEAIGAALREHEIDTVFIAARGTSDHAAIYAQYVFGVRHALPVALAAPSVLSRYAVEPRFGRTLVIGISQSGASPDIVGLVAAARRQGAPTVAITNVPASALGEAAEHTIDLAAGAERSIAATKTYTSELTAIALLSAAMRGSLAVDAPDLERLPDALTAVLATEAAAARAAADLAKKPSCVILGRGFEYATAREWALKLKELAYVVADPYSIADFQHGPIALVEPSSPVLLVAPSGVGSDDVAGLLPRLTEYGADLLVVSDRSDLLGVGRHALPLPQGIAEWLMPIVAIVPGQLYALHAALARGADPDAPRHLAKVTATR
jgi:glucosamine--fructose-6-phosphate aminotransferase (isomerizing)